MTSYIISAKQEEEQSAKANEICEKLTISKFDRTLITSDKETSLGIELIKKLQENVFLKPFQGTDKAVIIPQSYLLTIPAQNALLKLLEEPPAHTYLFLLTDTLEVFLPTILSRCQIISLTQKAEKLTKNETTDIYQQFLKWRTQSIGDALKEAEQLAKDKTKTLQSLERLIVGGDILLKESVKDQHTLTLLASQLRSLSQAYATLRSTNTSPRLTLENLFLSFISH